MRCGPGATEQGAKNLAARRWLCEGGGMLTLPDPAAPPRPPQLGGGCLIAAGLLIGPIVGIVFGQVTLGLIAGGVIGVVAAIIMAAKR